MHPAGLMFVISGMRGVPMGGTILGWQLLNAACEVGGAHLPPSIQ